MIPFAVPPAPIRATAVLLGLAAVFVFYEFIRIPSERDAAVMAFAEEVKTAGAEAQRDATAFARKIEKETRDGDAFDLRCAVFGDCADGGVPADAGAGGGG